MNEATTAPPTGSRHLALSVGWFGQNFHWLPIGFVLLQAQVAETVPHSVETSAIGLAAGLGGIFAVLVPPVTGLVSDRLRTPWGRRAPVMVIGLAGDVVGLAVMGTARSYWVLVGGYLVIQLFNNACGAAYAGLIPDLVPGAQFGRASGFLAAMNNTGGILGVLTTAVLAGLHQLDLAYAVIAVVIVLSYVPVLVLGRESPPTGPAPPWPSLGEAVRSMFGPLGSGDFAWVLGTRLLVTAAINVVAFFLSPFFASVVRPPNPSQFTSIWLLLVFLTGVPMGLIGGILSDRTGRKIFVYGSGLFQALVAIVFIAFYPTNVPVVIVLGLVYGIGYGLYYAVDWALAVDTLPDRERPAKDMGLFHASYTLPQVIVPLIGGVLIEVVSNISPGNGYRIVFGLSIIFFVLGSVFVSRVRGVR